MKCLPRHLADAGSQVKSAYVITPLWGTAWFQDFPAVARALAASCGSSLEWLAEWRSLGYGEGVRREALCFVQMFGSYSSKGGSFSSSSKWASWRAVS